MNFARIGSHVMHYTLVQRPSTPMLVFVNSLGTDGRIWDDVIRLLGDDVSYLTYDKRGHGLSEESPSVSIDDHAGDLFGLIEHCGLGPFSLIGLSVGGQIAQHVASRRPDGLRTLTLCSTAPKIGPAAAWDQRIELVGRQGMSAIAEAVIDRWFTPDFQTTEAVKVAGLRAMLTRMSPVGYAATCAAIRDADLTQALWGIEVPTLCIGGTQDQATPLSLVRSMADRIHNARFVEIPDAGHLPPLDACGHFTDALRTFLKETGIV